MKPLGLRLDRTLLWVARPLIRLTPGRVVGGSTYRILGPRRSPYVCRISLGISPSGQTGESPSTRRMGLTLVHGWWFSPNVSLNKPRVFCRIIHINLKRDFCWLSYGMEEQKKGKKEFGGSRFRLENPFTREYQDRGR